MGNVVGLRKAGHMDERRITVSYIVAVFVPFFLGFWLNGIGHFIMGRYKRGMVFLLGTIALQFILGFLLVAWPIYVIDAGYTLPWGDSPLPGVFITLGAGFFIWIIQVVDLARINRATS